MHDIERERMAAFCLPRRSPVVRYNALASSAETIGEDSAARLVVKATHCVWRSAPLLSAPRQP